MSLGWTNWSGSVTAAPALIVRPRTEDELAATVRASRKVRVVGAGHSFMPLCETDGALIDLADLGATVAVAPDRRSVWAPAGWSLKRLTQALWDKGLSLANQGDVNPQTLAGAIATGTHGTGAEIGSLSTFARAFRLMLADGSIVECSRDRSPDLFEAQRLSLGLLGIAIAICIDVVPAYRLEERIANVPFDEVLESFDSIAGRHRHAEFFMFPYTDRVILKTLHPTPDEGPLREPPASEEKMFGAYCAACAALPGTTATLQRQLMKFVRASRRVGPAHAVFPSERTVRFEEMEYELPRAAGLDTLREAVQWIRRKELPVTFPFEFRWVAADDIWLSPFNARTGASISIHQYAKMPWRDVFDEAETIFRAHEGRPHWAKRHTLGAADLYQLYPMAQRFRAVCDSVDPERKFSNAHLTRLFDFG
jgi:FAD-linked oxidoreductase